MSKIKTPEDMEILRYLNNLADYCIPMDGGKMRMTAQVWDIVKARDAEIGKECSKRAVDFIAKYGFAYVSHNVDLFVAAIEGTERKEKRNEPH